MMDVFARLLIRMSLWIRHPPSRQQIYIMAIVVVLAAIVVGIEWLGYWPDWMRVDKLPRSPGLTR
ncbi:hypothetical protein IFT59_18865 [Rhizobium sp. CFBP 8752]|nr:hypothetical protein [Rhizobium sp. CFBP 8752]